MPMILTTDPGQSETGWRLVTATDVPTAAAWLRAPWGSAAADAALLAIEREAQRRSRSDWDPAAPQLHHATGGSPDPYADVAAAPDRTFVPSAPQRLASKRQRSRAAKHLAGSADWSAVRDMSTSAAAKTLRGSDWSELDWEEVSAHLVLAVMERAAEQTPDGKVPSRCPLALCGYGWLCQRASDWRESRNAQRDRDRREDAKRDDILSDHYSDPAERDWDSPADVAGTPWGARRSAVRMLRSVGELAPGAPVVWGPMWTLAYGCARSVWTVPAELETDAQEGRTVVDESDPGAVAAELELTRAAYRKHCQRAADRLAARGCSLRSWRSALGLPNDTAGRALKPSRSRNLSGDIGHQSRKDGGRLALPRAQRTVWHSRKARPGEMKDRRKRASWQPDWSRSMERERPLSAARLKRLSMERAQRTASTVR